MSKMLLGVWDGFLTPEEENLSSVTKLGGRPIYMPPNEEAIAAAVRPLATCGVCADPMFLLLQCYCPLPNGNEDYNRMKYVFCCNNATCALQPEKSWVSVSVTSSTFDEEADNAEVAEDEDDIEELPGSHNHIPPFTFPSAGVDVIDEPQKSTASKMSEQEQHMLAEYERRQLKQKKIEEMRARGEEPDERELLEAGLTREDAEEMEKEIDLKNKASDVAFDKFRKRIERCPTQVVRYQYKGTPLFMNPGRVRDAKVPACGRCGAHQTMELQIMPTVIYLLKTSEYVKTGLRTAGALTAAAASAEVSAEVQEAVRAAGEGVDFASVTCYHCSNPKCGGDEAALFEIPEEGNSPFAIGGKGIIGGTEAVKFNIRKDFVLVEAAPDLEEEMHANPDIVGADGKVTAAKGPLAPKTLREIMFAPMPAEEDDGEEEAGEAQPEESTAAASSE